MNSFDRTFQRLQGEPVDRPPNFDIMMTFAAHYIKQPLVRYYLDYHVLCEANLAVQQDFGLDIVQVISDPYREAADFGVQVEFPEDWLPIRKAPLLQDPSDLAKLPRPDPSRSRRMSDRVEAVRTFREQVGREVPIMGWVEGALAEAVDLRSLADISMDFYDRPDWLLELLERCVEVEIAFAQAQVAAGADILGLGDAVASQVSPPFYRQFALPYEQRIFSAMHNMGAKTRLHICGNTTAILPEMLHSGADIIDLDWMVDVKQAARIFEGEPAICGNFNPVAMMLQGTPQQVRQAVFDCLDATGSTGFNAAGCEIPDATPIENLLAQKQALEEYQSQK
jgi:MtaA/CmuA family methyltransferase